MCLSSKVKIIKHIAKCEILITNIYFRVTERHSEEFYIKLMTVYAVSYSKHNSLITNFMTSGRYLSSKRALNMSGKISVLSQRDHFGCIDSINLEQYNTDHKKRRIWYRSLLHFPHHWCTSLLFWSTAIKFSVFRAIFELQVYSILYYPCIAHVCLGNTLHHSNLSILSWSNHLHIEMKSPSLVDRSPLDLITRDKYYFSIERERVCIKAAEV